MSNKNLKKQEWISIDFHTHSPAVSDYRGEPETSTSQIIEESIIKGLNAIAITDHSSSDALEDFLKASNKFDKNNGIFILAGTELKVVFQNEEVHLLLFLPMENAVEMFRDLFNITGVSREISKGIHLERVVIEQEPMSIVEQVSTWGGFSIISHIDRPINGQTNIDGIILYELIKNPSVLAVEVENISSIDQMKQKAGNIVFCSDSHSLAEIGRRYSKILIKELSFEGIKESLEFHKKEGIEIKLF